MVTLKDTNPDVHKQFLKGNSMVKKTPCSFSDVAIDQVYEQNNASVKGKGGAVG